MGGGRGVRLPRRVESTMMQLWVGLAFAVLEGVVVSHNNTYPSLDPISSKR